MELKFSEDTYNQMLQQLFQRFPSFQKDGQSAYKPGIANMEFMDQLLGHPHKAYKIIHIAGTNGKGSVSSMLASSLSSLGFKVGLYTSPHILDFRERMRIISRFGSTSRIEESTFSYITKEYVFDFVTRWQDTFDHLDLSFFEITTAMALQWFKDKEIDILVLETGLGGRLDSTNIVTPVLSVVTNIGLDHCDLLGETLPEIAFEKAGIIKPGVPVIVGESHPDTDSVFERKVLYTNLPDPAFMGNRDAIMSLLTFADKVEPSMWDKSEQLLVKMDLQGDYQRKNLRTVLAVLDVIVGILHTSGMKICNLSTEKELPGTFLLENCKRSFEDAIINTAKITDFHGRWEKLSDAPLTICDIGHNEHGLRHNFAQLKRMIDEGRCSTLIVIYGSVADKDVDSVIHLFPDNAIYIFTQADSRRALPAQDIKEKYVSYCRETGREFKDVYSFDSVGDAVTYAMKLANDMVHQVPYIYIGGSTYVVSEAVQKFTAL